MYNPFVSSIGAFNACLHPRALQLQVRPRSFVPKTCANMYDRHSCSWVSSPTSPAALAGCFTVGFVEPPPCIALQRLHCATHTPPPQGDRTATSVRLNKITRLGYCHKIWLPVAQGDCQQDSQGALVLPPLHILLGISIVTGPSCKLTSNPVSSAPPRAVSILSLEI